MGEAIIFCIDLLWLVVSAYFFKIHFFIAFISVIFFIYERIYFIRFDFWQDILRIFKALFLSFVISLILANFLQIEYFSIFLYFGFLFITFPFIKRFSKKFVYKFFKEKILIIGENKNEVELFENEIKKNWYLGGEVSKNFDKVIIISSNMTKEKLNFIVEKYLQKTPKVYIVPYLTEINFLESQILEFTNIKRNAIEFQNRLLVKRNIFIKSLLDKILLIITFPIFILLHFIIALAIKIEDKGEVFFKQKRLGKNGKIFEVYKYRTMKENQDILNQYLKENPDEIEYYKKYHKYKNDPRITKVGKFLRKTSLDELPQIINILKGEMSFIGPRPYMVDEVDLKKLNLILKVKPGITGLWQVSGRNNLEFEKRIELENYYIKNWSLWTDFVILLKTVKEILKKSGK